MKFNHLALVAAILFIIAGSCETFADDSADYVAKRVQAIHVTLPPGVRANSRAARTYVYWQTAAGEIHVCMDLKTMTIDRGLIVVGVGPKLREALKVIPADGVDPAAVTAVQHLAHELDDLSDLNTKLGLSGALSAAKILIGALDDGGPDFDSDDSGGDGSGFSFGGIFSIYRIFKKMHDLGDLADSELEHTRVRLAQNYHLGFAEISISQVDLLFKRSTIFNPPAGFCRLSF